MRKLPIPKAMYLEQESCEADYTPHMGRLHGGLRGYQAYGWNEGSLWQTERNDREKLWYGKGAYGYEIHPDEGQ